MPVNPAATPTDDHVPVIVRAATTDYDEPIETQRKAAYAIGDDRRQVLADAVAPRMQPWALEPLSAELDGHPQITGAGDVIVRRDYGAHGHLEVTIIEARGRLARRYVAVSRLPEGERELYLDALLDDELERRGDAARIHIGQPAPPVAEGAVPMPAPAPDGGRDASPGAVALAGEQGRA
jgi:hypothetical protein